MRSEADRLQGIVQDILEHYFDSPHFRVEVSLVDAREMRSLNRTFRGLDKPTDVLSFSAPTGFPQLPEPGETIGEIYLCSSYIRAHGTDVYHLLVHGLLHLLGFDHVEKRARIRMQKLELKILAWLKNRY